MATAAFIIAVFALFLSLLALVSVGDLRRQAK